LSITDSGNPPAFETRHGNPIDCASNTVVGKASEILN